MMKALNMSVSKAGDSPGGCVLPWAKAIAGIIFVLFLIAVARNWMTSREVTPADTTQTVSTGEPSAELMPPRDRSFFNIPSEIMAGDFKMSSANLRLYMTMREELYEKSGDHFITDQDYTYWSERIETLKESGYLDYTETSDAYALDRKVIALRGLYGLYLDYKRYGGCGEGQEVVAHSLTGRAMSFECVDIGEDD